mgnify:CR=1 FL=1
MPDRQRVAANLAHCTGCGLSRCARRFAAVADEDARARPPRAACAQRLPIRSPRSEIRAAGTMLPRAPRSVVEERRELRVHLVEVADRMLVEDDDVRGQPFQAPVLLRLQHLAHAARASSSPTTRTRQDRQIAGNRVRPESGLTELVGGEPAGIARAARHRRTARATRAARRAAPRRSRCRDDAVRSARA